MGTSASVRASSGTSSMASSLAVGVQRDQQLVPFSCYLRDVLVPSWLCCFYSVNVCFDSKIAAYNHNIGTGNAGLLIIL